MLILTQEAGTISPIGWVLIIGFAVILVWALIHDKKKANSVVADFRDAFDGKILDKVGSYMVTADREFIVLTEFINYSEYQVYKLDDIKYVMASWDQSVKMWALNLYDCNKKLIAGQKINSNKKKSLTAKAKFLSNKEEKEVWEMIHKYVPQAEYVGAYFKAK